MDSVTLLADYVITLLGKWRGQQLLSRADMAGQDTPLVSVEDYEEHALRVLPRSAADFYRCGAGEEFTLRSNSRAFNRYIYKYVVL
uniref:Uncharacterized protein n=1 Tax=Timema tahoe TaxID=61484 RepID=A0A7R9ID11_9NEOP|nr:unnamed protein product [Timema tahoe]